MKILNHVLKSPNDKLKYKAIELLNGLKVILIQDKEAQKCSAVMNVSRGVFSDPKDMGGIAHFLEHMLFMGSKKYPDPSYYRDQVSKYSGKCNAYTDLMNTVYYYESNKDGFMECLDIFGQFFIEPILDKKYVDKELKAVNSEFEKNLNNDFWRSFNLRRSLSHPDSLLNRFLQGNNESLNKENVLEVLKQFYQDNYSANLMNLVVYQEKEIEDIEQTILQIFDKVPNKNLNEYDFQNIEFPYQKDQLCKQINFQSFSEQYQLEFFFYFESQLKHYKNDPMQLLSSLIGHESKGSVAFLLKERGLIFDLSTGPYKQGNYFGFLMIRIQLTEKGYKNIIEIHKVLSQYIQMLKKEGVPEWYFKELKQTKNNKFEFQQSSNGLGVSLNIATKMDQYPIEHVRKYAYLMESYKPDLINEYINNLKVENMLVMLCHKSFENLPEQEYYYKTPYEKKQLDEEIVRVWKEQSLSTEDQNLLHLPAQNTFIPENFEILNVKGSEYPLYIQQKENENFGEVFYKFDDKFRSSKIDMRFKLFTKANGVGSDPRVYIMMSLWSNILQNYLMDFSYLANEAGIRTDIAYTHEGIYIRIDGFSDKLDLYANELANKILDYSLNINEEFLKKEFDSNKQKKILQYKRLLLQDPFRLQLQEKDMLQREKEYDYHTLSKACQKIQFEEFQNFFKLFLNQFYYRSYLAGNLEQTKALEINNNFMSTLQKIGEQRDNKFEPLPHESILSKRCIQLEEDTTHVIVKYLEKEEEQNDCVLVNFQCENQDVLDREYISLLENYLDPKAFHSLRTELQLGYVVFTKSARYSNVCNLYFMIQSQEYIGVECVGQIYNFVNQMKDTILNISDKEIEELKENYIKSLEQKFNNLAQESGFYWNKIKLGNYEFNTIKKSQEAAKNITVEKFREFVQKLFYVKPRVVEYYLLCKKNEDRNKEALKIRELFETKQFKKWDTFGKLKKNLNLYKDINNQTPFKTEQLNQKYFNTLQVYQQQISMLFQENEQIKEDYNVSNEISDKIKKDEMFKRLYNPNLQNALDIFRYLLVNEEISQRGMILSNHYPAWLYRKQYIQSNTQSISREINMTKQFIEQSPKGFQQWDYLQYCFQQAPQLFNYEDVKQFLQVILEIDSRNYHCWQFRIWMTQNFDLYSKEKIYIEQNIKKDVINNSYWNYMHFVNQCHDDMEKDQKNQLIEQAQQLLELNLENEAAWNYLNSLCEHDEFQNEHIQYCKKILESNPNNRFCLSSLVFNLKKQNIQNNNIKSYLDKLIQIDEFRINYWKWIKSQIFNDKINQF